MAVGSDGEGARAKSNDKSAEITLTLMQSSASNDLLSSLSRADELTGDGVGPLLVVDRSGRTLIEAATCWIQKPADGEFGREIANREWMIATDSAELFHGGN